MIRLQNDIAVVPMPEIPDTKSFWEDLKGMGLDDIISTVSNSVINFAFKLIIALVVFYLGRFLIRKLYKGVSNIMTKRDVDTSLITFVLSLIKISLYFILIITVIGILGVETSSFIAIFASAGVAIGMALSGTLQNFAGGVLILLLKPYKVGDFIEVQGFSGTVKSIQLFNTVINTPDNKSIILPNGSLSTASVNNYSLEDYRRVDWTIGLSYGTDFEGASQAILAIINSDSRVVKQYIEEDSSYRGGSTVKVERKPFVGLSNLGDSAIQITARAWTHKDNYWPLFFDLNKRFYTELPKRGFSFPFPQMDVHLSR